MRECAVVNASPLIFLAKAGLIHLLQHDAASRILVPAAVAQEINYRGHEDRMAQALASTPWLITVDELAIPGLIAAWDLGPGESAVLTYARAHPETAAIIDHAAGRRCAETLGISLLGTLGLMMMAKQRGLIPAARPVLALHKQQGMFLAELKNKGQPRSGETGMFFMPPRRARAGRFAGGWRDNAVRRRTARLPESPSSHLRVT